MNLEKTFKLIFKTNFALNALMLDLPNIEDCDTEEWDAIVDKFIKSSKIKMMVVLLTLVLFTQ